MGSKNGQWLYETLDPRLLACVGVERIDLYNFHPFTLLLDRTCSALVNSMSVCPSA